MLPDFLIKVEIILPSAQKPVVAFHWLKDRTNSDVWYSRPNYIPHWTQFPLPCLPHSFSQKVLSWPSASLNSCPSVRFMFIAHTALGGACCVSSSGVPSLPFPPQLFTAPAPSFLKYLCGLVLYGDAV